MGLLTDILSRVDAMKRRGAGLLSNPADTLAAWAAPDPADPNLGSVGSVMPGVSQNAIRGLLQSNAGMATDVAMNSPMGFMGKIVYHGSPHTFDKFDMSKIGTGEGWQAYGHGLYFAETPEVARTYKNPGGMRSGTAPLDIDGVRAAQWMQSDARTPIEKRAADSLQRNRNTDYAISYLEQDAPYDPVAKAAADWIKANDSRISKPGNLYRVDIPDEHIAKMLDWDKPLSEQPQGVRDAMVPVVEAAKRSGIKLADETAGGIMAAARWDMGTKGEVEQLLRSRGVPGIRYLDQGSRAGGQGTSNYVLFDDALAKIVGRE